MNDDVRIAALRAASKLALGMTLGIGATGAALGCGGAPVDDATPAGTSDDALTDRGEPAPERACEDAAAPVPAPSCKELLTSTFASPAWDDLRDYRWEPTDVPATSDAVRACCNAAFGENGWSAPEIFHWECCNLLGGGNSVAEGNPMGCTPWGPPVPPSMAFRARGVA